MKPGKPTTMAVNNKKAVVFALPGNPVSCYVTSLVFVIPAIKRLQGLPEELCFPN